MSPAEKQNHVTNFLTEVKDVVHMLKLLFLFRTFFFILAYKIPNFRDKKSSG